MATKRMLIDAAHPEETRVAVIEGDRLTDYDVEVASRRQLKGNIYLAKVTRVEPSLQAAFVDYGGNRHGFLAFNEIHPDYYQIPVADREALLAEHAAAEQDTEANKTGDNGGEGEGDGVDTVGGVDDDEVEVSRPRPLSRHYKIQEVIKRRQILLVQVTKEERGTKGAALTTYLSLAGRYCVLMPNTVRGGGISRKITSVADRKRLKKIVGELGVPEGMAVILRTAGSERSKAEIRRDYEYLIRLWSSIREVTLKSMAPTLVYEEGNLIKRTIRDLYDRSTDEILIEGESAYRTAKDFMKLFIPSHAKRVKLYEEPRRPLFLRYNVHNELEAMHLPFVQLKSGGSIVLNPTEALVAVDVNSGRSTRERHIEETALRTNLEACDEIARQLRLRDLAGLVVVDFIDMENARNQGQVERRLKEAMKLDRARVQIGRISPFGLLELSRQRLRPSLLEASFEVCPACSGTGLRRSKESTALAILRRIEQTVMEGKGGAVDASVPTPVAFYLLNQKRKSLQAIEDRFQVSVSVSPRDDLPPPHFDIALSGEPIAEAEALPAVDDAAEAALAAEDADAAEEVAAAADDDDAEKGDVAKRSRKRRPRRRPRSDGEAGERAAPAGDDQTASPTETGDEEAPPLAAEGDEDAEAGSDRREDEDQDEASAAAKKRRRRGRRGGRRRSRRSDDEGAEAMVEADIEAPAHASLPFPNLPGPGTLLTGPAMAAAGDGSEARATVPTTDSDSAVAVSHTDGEPTPEPDVETISGGSTDADRQTALAETNIEGERPFEAEPGPEAVEHPVEELDSHHEALPRNGEMMASEGAGTAAIPPHDEAADAEPPAADTSAVEAGIDASAGGDALKDDAVDDTTNGDASPAEDTADEPSETEHSVVVHVGRGDDTAGENRRRGWWRRSLE
ncbi:MAG: ribonuclease E/G [Rhodospirillales bacterium]|nr:MAG: ribonuclease E/G [Rhodospirillales bacterium]